MCYAHTSDHVLLQHSRDIDTKSLAGATVTSPILWQCIEICLLSVYTNMTWSQYSRNIS